MMNKTNDVTAS